MAASDEERVAKIQQLVERAKACTALKEDKLATLFAMYDSSKDLTKEEFGVLWKDLGFQEEYLGKFFTAIDTDGSGTVSFKELLGGLTVCSGADNQATAELLLKLYDVDQSGQLDVTEYMAAVKSSIRTVKAGILTAVGPTLESLAAFQSMMMAMSQAMEAPEGQPVEGPSPEEILKQQMQELDSVCTMPTDDEILSGFKEIDTDGSGKLTVQELAQALERDEIKKIFLPQLGVKEFADEIAPQELGPPECTMQ